MDISSVKSPPVQPPQQPKRSEEAQQAQNRDNKPKETEVKKTAEAKPPPVINTQGQTTGRILNTTA